LLWLVIFAAAAGGAWVALRFWQRRSLAALQQQEAPSLLDGLALGGPALLYFNTADCGQCRFQQEPILQRLSATVAPAALQVVPLDAIEREELARHFGIMTVPSTVLLDSTRRPVAINHGVAPLQKLQEQLALVQ
jgi:thioredoxin 1